jgi:hypothetical protein
VLEIYIQYYLSNRPRSCRPLVHPAFPTISANSKKNADESTSSLHRTSCLVLRCNEVDASAFFCELAEIVGTGWMNGGLGKVRVEFCLASYQIAVANANHSKVWREGPNE